MQPFDLIHRSLIHHKRTNLAVLLGAAVGTAVLTGALLVGDSVRGSLRQLTLDRLGNIDYAMTSDRYFGEALSASLTKGLEDQELFFVPSILQTGTAAHADTKSLASRVNVIGVDKFFWMFVNYPPPRVPEGREVILNATLAAEIGAKVGDSVLVRVEKPSYIPRDSALGSRNETVITVRLEVKSILPPKGVGRFGLHPSQQFPLIAYLPLPTLQKAMGQKGRANTIFAARPKSVGQSDEPLEVDLEPHLKKALTLDDLGLQIRATADGNFYSIESRRLIIDSPLVPVLDLVAAKLGARHLPVFTYLANRISLSPDEKPSGIPYSTITAIDFSKVDGFGRISLTDGNEAPPLDAGEIYLNEWAASDLGANPGDPVHVDYYVIGKQNELLTRKHTFRLRGIVSLSGLAADPNLTPEYPGIENAKSMFDWVPPFPINLKLIRPRDDAYWKEHRTTPKAFVSLETGQKLWSSRFGKLTSVRLASDTDAKLPPVEDARAAIREAIDPMAFGLSFQAIKKRGLDASKGATDFGGLFIGFSMFLIASAALLVGLLFRLGVERRGEEIGILLATGHSLRSVQRLFLAEGAALAGLGGLLGLIGAYYYAALMMAGLRTWWVGAVGTPFLELHVGLLSIVIGLMASFLVILFSIWRTVRKVGALPVRTLLAGGTPETDIPGIQRKPRSWKVAWCSLCLAVLLMLAAMGGVISEMAGFFAGGSLFLIGTLALLSGWLRRTSGSMVSGHGLLALLNLGARNGARHPGRSVLTASLVACATFIIIAVAANRHDPTYEKPDINSGNGGFALIAESALPLYHSLSDPKGLQSLGLSKHKDLIASAKVFHLRKRPGEDASCLNLYQPTRPNILGVPDDLIGRGGFLFQSTLPGGDSNPWKLLQTEFDDDAIPVFGDMNTVMWILHLGLGKDLEITSESGERFKLRIAGTLKRSIFQSELLMSESNFLRLFPSLSGHRAFLIQSPLEKTRELSNALEEGLALYGFDATRTSDRLANYLVVENTYLSTFQTLGGLGLLLGTLGLGTVLLRNVFERRAELAMLRALGFRRRNLAVLVLAENAFLLILGLLSGTLSAVLAVSPHLLSGGADVSWPSLILTLLLVLTAGLASGSFAVISSLKTPLLPALRGD